MSLSDLDYALASGDPHPARRAIRACGARLHEAGPAEIAELVNALAPLASHANAIVRQAVADVCDVFPQALFDQTHERLLADDDPYVRASARAAGDRRAQQRRKRARIAKEEQALDEALDEIERRHGKGARRIAERAVERGVEHFAQMLDHETRKTKNAIHVALAELAAELDRPERSVGVLKERLATLRERLAFVFSIVRRACEYATRVKPAFREETLREVVHEARAQLLGRMGAHGSKVVFAVDVDDELRAVVNRGALLQALQNVLQNAAEAYADGAERWPVRVAARETQGGAKSS